MSTGENWVKVEGLPEGPLSEPTVVKAGSKRIVIVDTGKGYKGMEVACPHLKAPMTKGILMAGGTMIRCPKHNFIYRLSDGKGVNCLGLELEVYETRASDAGVEVNLPD